jgi:hypothetical protein
MIASVSAWGLWTPPRHSSQTWVTSLDLTYADSAGIAVQNWTILKTIIEPPAEIAGTLGNLCYIISEVALEFYWISCRVERMAGLAWGAF